MKKVVMIFVFVSFISLALASFSVTNISIDKSYPLNQIFQGEMTINVSDMDADVRLTSSMGHDFLFLDLLKDSALYDCVPNDCGNRYELGDMESSLSFDLGLRESSFWGFVLEGTNINVKNVSYDVSSDFGDGISIPLRMNIFEASGDWIFNEYSDNVFRDARPGDFYDEDERSDGPIIGDTTYCSEFYIYETDLVRIKFDFDLNNGTGDLKVELFNDQGSPVLFKTFTPSSGLNSVDIMVSSDDLFSAGKYYVCVGAAGTSGEIYEASKYKLYQDITSGKYGAFSYSSGGDFNFTAAIAPNKTKNYAIFVQEAVYADASKLSSANFLDSKYVANSLISQKYGNDCSQGCVFPVKLMAGVEQNLVIDNVVIDYSTDGGNFVESEISKLNVNSAKMYFSGVLDFDALRWVMNESGNFELYLDGEEILGERVEIVPAPIIKGIYPNVIPAGISALLFADVEYERNGSLTYEWDFGDGSSQTTTNNTVFHLFRNVSKYTIGLIVSDGNLSNFIETEINTVSPKEYIGVIYNQMSLDLNKSISDIESFPSWQQKTLNDALDIVTIEFELKRIGRKIREAIDDADYLEIAGMLNVLDVPKAVFISETFAYDVPLADFMDMDAIAEYTGESLDPDISDDDYATAIALWQDEEVTFSIMSKRITLFKTSGVIQDLFRTYLISMESDFDEDTFFVINKPRDDIIFNNVLKAPKIYGESTFLPLGVGLVSYEFFVLGGEEVDFFASPMIRDLVLAAEITRDCNFNNICEEGESSSTCRSDCKPVNSMIFYIILAFVFGLILYTIIQVWYTKYYEKVLFKEKRRLNNLLVFITSAKSSGKNEVEIRDMLKKKGWTGERVDYAIKKANGERTGLYEIIPISKISAYFRKKKVIKGGPLAQPISGRSMLGGRKPMLGGGRSMGNKGRKNIATSSKQQMGRNINKADRQNFKRGK